MDGKVRVLFLTESERLLFRSGDIDNDFCRQAKPDSMFLLPKVDGEVKGTGDMICWIYNGTSRPPSSSHQQYVDAEHVLVFLNERVLSVRSVRNSVRSWFRGNVDESCGWIKPVCPSLGFSMHAASLFAP